MCTSSYLLFKCAQVIGIKKGGHMVQTTAILNGFMQKIKNAGLSLGESYIGYYLHDSGFRWVMDF